MFVNIQGLLCTVVKLNVVKAQAAQAQRVSLIVNTCSFILRNLKWP